MTETAPADHSVAPVTALAKAALYLRVSTGRRADNDLSIPDQRRQIENYCLGKGWEVAAEYVEPGNTATDDRRPPFQAMIEAAMTKPPMFTVIIVHSFSRFFRDQFQFEFYVRKLAKNGVRLISITQDLGEDSMGNMVRQIMTLFDEYQSNENAKHTLRAMKENARQGYWNGALHLAPDLLDTPYKSFEGRTVRHYAARDFLAEQYQLFKAARLTRAEG